MKPHRLVLFLLLAFSSSILQAQQISPALAKALEAARTNTATAGQQALLFQNNNVINQAALSGWIPDATYQAAQREYAQLNAKLAAEAANMQGAKFTPQVSKSETYSPGTDSDYIVTTTSDDPVGQIQKIQENYNELINRHLKEALEAEGLHHVAKDNWHNRLDVDFMADPAHVTDGQFQKIAELNNDAYKRRGAAEYERRLRGKDLPPITPEQFSDYAAEMQDFIAKKEGKLDKYRKSPSLLKDPGELAEMHRLMAQESKYVSRIEEAADALRGQEWLAGNETPKGPPVYELTTQPNGEVTIRTRSESTIAARGSKRRRSNRGAAIASSALVNNSVERALGNLAEAMADAYQKNPGKWKDAPARIAEVSEQMSPQARGKLLERLRDNWSGYDLDEADTFTRQVANEMRQRARTPPPLKQPEFDPGNSGSVVNSIDDFDDIDVLRTPEANLPSRASLPQQLDDAIRSGLGISDDLAGVGRARRGLNQLAGQALGQLDRLETLGNVADAAEVVGQATTYLSSLRSAMDPEISDKEADEHFRRAQNAALGMAKTGALGALTQAVPTVGAVMGGWAIGYDGTRFVLENTETGRRIDRKTEEYFQRHGQALQRARSSLTAYFGGETDQMAEQGRLQDLESSYWEAIRNGRIRLKPGVRTLDVAAMLRDGDLIGVHDLIEPGENASDALIDRLTKTPQAGSTPPAKTQARRSGPAPIDSIEFENQTFDLAGDVQTKEQYDAMLRHGKLPIGPAERDGRDSLPMEDSVDLNNPRNSFRSKTPLEESERQGDSSETDTIDIADLLNLEAARPQGSEPDAISNAAPTVSPRGSRITDEDDLLEDLIIPQVDSDKSQDRDGFGIDDLLTFDKEDVLTTDDPADELALNSQGDTIDNLLTFDADDLNTTSSDPKSRSKTPAETNGLEAYRQRAEQINNRLVAVERQREAQRRAALEAQRQAAIEAQRQAVLESQRRAALAEYERQRQQEIARQRTIAAQREQYAREQLARQQQIYRQQQVAQQIAAMQRQQVYQQQQAARQRQAAQYYRPTQNYGNGYNASGGYIGKVQNLDGSILGSDYYKPYSGYNNFLGRNSTWNPQRP
ncbi:hypothetical protein CKO51_24655 [Rhodopirellula sp. SM50]|nr:hypothetical protein [Rhodopirellula sp. SM50]PAY16830.1 hypothetical protein CKO51_24655 [Rhodopirellula sp. SM50]